jgi:hypothetical protein
MLFPGAGLVVDRFPGREPVPVHAPTRHRWLAGSSTPTTTHRESRLDIGQTTAPPSQHRPQSGPRFLPRMDHVGRPSGRTRGSAKSLLFSRRLSALSTAAAPSYQPPRPRKHCPPSLSATRRPQPLDRQPAASAFHSSRLAGAWEGLATGLGQRSRSWILGQGILILTLQEKEANCLHIENQRSRIW